MCLLHGSNVQNLMVGSVLILLIQKKPVAKFPTIQS